MDNNIKNIFQNMLKLCVFAPLIIMSSLLSLVIPSKASGVSLMIYIPILISLATIGFSFLSNNKIIRKVGYGLLILLTIALCITGYYDYLKWFSTIVGIVNFLYLNFILMLLEKLKNYQI